MRCSI